MKNFTFVKFNKRRTLRGFTVKRGFIGCVCDGKLIAVSSGWCNDQPYDGGHNSAAVYTRVNGKWKMQWADYGTAVAVVRSIADEAIRRAYAYDENYLWHINMPEE